MNEIEKIIEQELERYARENWEFNEVLRKEVPFDVEDCKWCDLVAFARHFYDLGCTRTAEKYDEIEYNRQRAEDGVPKDLEEAAGLWYEKCPFPKSTWWDEGEEMKLTDSRETFIAGAKWQKEQDEKEQADLFTIVALDAAERAKKQMMEEAVEGDVTTDNRGNNVVRAGVFNKDFEYGDKVRVIIVKEDKK